MLATKTCNGPTCEGISKPATEFYRNRARPDGLSSTCKRCQLEFTGRDHVRDRINAQRREHLAADPELAAANSAKAADWQRINPDRAHFLAKRYRDSEKRACAISGCDNSALSHSGKALCSTHQQRVDVHGDPYTVLTTPTGEDHPRWVGDRAGYTTAHGRITAKRGKASAHACAARCGAAAEHWSYRGGAPDERTELREMVMHGKRRAWYAPYSLDSSFYDPLCRGCHTKRDVWKKDVVAAHGV